MTILVKIVTNKFGEFSLYENALWVKCEKDGDQYTITEIMPMEIQQ